MVAIWMLHAQKMSKPDSSSIALSLKPFCWLPPHDV